VITTTKLVGLKMVKRDASMTTHVRFLIILSLTAFCVACGGGSSGGNNNGLPPVNSAPTAVIDVSKTSGYAPLSLVFDGSMSSDPDGNVTEYSWDFGDGATSLGSQANHTYTALGLFTATLTITDDDGANSSTSVQIDSHAQIAGYYTGSIFSNVTQSFTDVEVIIGTNHKIHAYDWINFRTSYWGDFSVTEDRATGMLSAEIWDPAFVFPDGTMLGIIDVDADILARQNVFATYSGVGDNGTIDIQYLPELAERPSSLSDVSGIWDWTDGLGYTATLMVSQSGELDYSDTDGCTGQGQLDVLDPSLNGFQVQFDWNCAPDFGPWSGLAFIDDFYDPGTQWIVITEASLDNATSAAWSLMRPEPIAASGSVAQANKVSGLLYPRQKGRKDR